MNGATLTVPDQFKTGEVLFGGKCLSSTAPRYKIREVIEKDGYRDYYCRKCKKTVYYSLWQATYCPHCGTPIFSASTKKIDAEMRHNWHDYEEMKYAGPDKRSRMEAKRKGFPERRTGKSARSK